jgi:hypothetical protein
MHLEAIKYILPFVEEMPTLGHLSCVCHGYQVAISNWSKTIINTVLESKIFPLPVADATVFNTEDISYLKRTDVSVIKKFGAIHDRIRVLEASIPELLSFWDESPPPKSVSNSYKQGLQQCFDAIQFMVRLGAHENLNREIKKYSPLLDIRLHTFEDLYAITVARLQKNSERILHVLSDDTSNTISRTDRSFFCTLETTRNTFQLIVSHLEQASNATAFEKWEKVEPLMLFCVVKSILKIISIYEKLHPCPPQIGNCEEALFEMLGSPTCFNINAQEETSPQNTLLMYAVSLKSRISVSILLNRGADPAIENTFGLTALNIARMLFANKDDIIMMEKTFLSTQTQKMFLSKQLAQMSIQE